jgi:glycosyltransferase involved in cell wall biosynthesis
MPVEFSVIIPTYRRPKELRAAVASALRQTGTTIEVLIIDDSPEGSARETVENLQDSRLTYLRNSNPTGGVPSIVRNLAWPRANGKFVHFLDDDDIIPDDHYVAVRSAFASYPQIGVVFGRIEPFGNGPQAQLVHEMRYFADAARRAAKSRRFGSRWGFTGQTLFDQALVVCSAAVLRRDCVVQIGGFDPTIRLMEDSDFFLRATRKFGAYFMDRVALHYRIGSPSLLHSPNPGPAQRQYQRDGRRRMQAKYREEHGALEYYALAAFSRTLLRMA